jgi:hypothetical protein
VNSKRESDESGMNRAARSGDITPHKQEVMATAL